MNSENQTPKNDSIMSELTTLGKNLGAAVRSVLDSPQRYEIEEEVRTGFQTVVTEINDAIAKARTADVSKEVAEQTNKAVETIQTSAFTEELRQGLVKGLHTLNDELADVLSNLEKPEQATEQAKPAQSATAAEPAEATVPDEPVEPATPVDPVEAVEPESEPIALDPPTPEPAAEPIALEPPASESPETPETTPADDA